MVPLTIGTAGHIDHGKSTLVRALSAEAATDRLPEERARGMTIALGYSRLTLPSGREMSMVDVPGHERFVRTMVAGATGIDMFLMVIAADDSVMPQTIEHARVLRALGVDHGVVAVTKADLADPGRAAGAAAELLPGAPVIACSVRTREGIDGLTKEIELLAARLHGRAERSGGAVLHVDRVFTVRGAGTVVTGTLWSGAIDLGGRVRLLPSGREARVRGVQVHDRPSEHAAAGQRVAVNLAGVRREEIRRGDVLASTGSDLGPTFRLDLALELDHPPEGRMQVHHGTRDVAARLVHLGEDLWQARLEKPLIARRGDRVVVRSIAPADTRGGGVVLDAAPRRHGASAELVHDLRSPCADKQDPPPPATAGGALRRSEPGSRAPAAAHAAPAELSPGALALEQQLRDAGPRPPSEAEMGELAEHLPELRAAGRAVRVGRALYAHPEAIERLAGRVAHLIERDGAVTLAGLRDDLGGSRRYAQALLEYLDAARITRRLPDDSRVLRRRSGGEASGCRSAIDPPNPSSARALQDPGFAPTEPGRSST
jgi:selenocysteine-specific elongation factor